MTLWRRGILSLLALLLGITAGSAHRPAPRLLMDDSVAADFRALASATWSRFLLTFAARADCIGDVHLRASRTLAYRALYDPTTATVTVRVPGTPAMLQSALIHEWAHHLEYQCPAHRQLRPHFLEAQGLPPTTPWRPAGEIAAAPEAIPSEQYAEAVVELVLGERPIPTKAHVTVAAVETVRAWAAGDLQP